MAESVPCFLLRVSVVEVNLVFVKVFYLSFRCSYFGQQKKHSNEMFFEESFFYFFLPLTDISVVVSLYKREKREEINNNEK